MFNKLKEFKDLRKQAKTMQGVLADVVVSHELDGLKISLNGNLEVIEVIVPEEIDKSLLPKKIKDCFNQVIKKAQRIMAEKMREMGGIPGL